jgi:hypothetical protein
LTEERTGRAKSVFHFDVQGTVAKFMHAGIPLAVVSPRTAGRDAAFLAVRRLGNPGRRSAVAEVYPALWSRGFAAADRSADQHDAFSIAAWLSRADREGSVERHLNPEL